MRRVRVVDSSNNVVSCLVADDQEDLAALVGDGDGYTIIVEDDAPPEAVTTSPPHADDVQDHRHAPEATTASPPHPLGSAEATARAAITQTLADFCLASRELLALNLHQTRHWLALGTRTVDEDVRRRDIMHKALKDLDIADRSIGVMELQAKQQAWAPAPSPAPAPAQEDGITNFLGAVTSVGKQLLDLDKKN